MISQSSEIRSRTGNTGRGRENSDKTSNYKTTFSEIDVAMLSFLADGRIPSLFATKPFVSKNESKEKRGKTLNYEKESKEVREKA